MFNDKTFMASMRQLSRKAEGPRVESIKVAVKNALDEHEKKQNDQTKEIVKKLIIKLFTI